MSKGGGAGGSQTTSVQIPEYIEAAAQRNLNKAERISQLGYVPYYGPDVAAFTPMQQAAMQNVAGAASAFGLAAPTGQDVYGMPAPTEYAGGIQGYSSAPMYQQAVDQLALYRPAQKSYIDSFFIDPYTGAYGSNVQAPIDYTGYSTGAQQQREQQAFDLAMSMRQPGSTLTQAEFAQNLGIIGNVIGDPTYDGTRVLTAEERLAVSGSPAAQLAQDTIYMNQLGNASNSFIDDASMMLGYEPTFASPSSAGSYGGSLVTGELSGDFTPLVGITGAIGDTLVTNLAPGYAMDQQTKQLAEAAGSTLKDDGTYDISSWFTDTSATPTLTTSSNNDSSPAMPMTYGDSTFVDAVTSAGSDVSAFLPPAPSSGGSDDNNTIGQISPGGQDAGAGFEWVDKGSYLTRTYVGNDDDSGGSSSSSDKILCCAYYKLGYLPRDIWRLDQQYGVWLHRNDPELMRGYLAWAAPLAEYVQRDTRMSKIVRSVMRPIVVSWAKQMANDMKPEKYAPNYAGKVIKFIGEPFSRLCGKLKSRKIEEMA